MKKIYFTLPLFLCFLFLNPSSTLALEIKVSNDYIEFYQDEILGKKSDESNSKIAPTQKIPTAGKSLRVNPVGNRLEVNVQDKKANQKKLLKPSQSTKTQRLNLQTPSQLKDKTKAKGEDSNYLEKVREERRNRREEMTQIRARIQNEEASMAIESRGVKARVKNGAEFSIDAQSNEITITTPSGNTHTLNHLPDQAIEKMKESGKLSPEIDNDQLLDITTGKDGNLKLEFQEEEDKKLFGLFTRKLRRKYQLDDQTGEIQELGIESNSLLESVLNKLSF
ncbi:MAG: hypothetical protein ABFQ62_01050 [Patescibacteria group bacterium]